MARRGPDDSGFWSDARACALGFRRLAILDLTEAGHQPMVTADGRHALVFNGEVYNYPELRQRLVAHGVRIRSTGDAEVVLQALATWGPRALADFNGMFALGFYDRIERRLLLARDHAGIKPLHFAETARGIVFASQANQLLQHPWLRGLPLSAAGVRAFLRRGYVPENEGLVEGCHALEPGTWIAFGLTGSVSKGRSYVFRPPGERRMSAPETAEALDLALRRAVARHLASDVPLGVFLSGGVDSPLVAAEAARQVGPGLRAFTIGARGSSNDETSAAYRFAHALGVDHVSLPLDASSVIEMLPEVMAACGEPLADDSIFPTFALARLARRQVTVALSGDGGDELFWGYTSRFVSVLEQAPYFREPRPLRALRVAARRFLGVGHATRDALLPTLGDLYSRKHVWLRPGDAALVLDGDPREADETLFRFSGFDQTKCAEFLREAEYRLNLPRILAKVDMASMYHSLEVRVPLLDREVIDVALQSDWRTCLDLTRRQGKLPLRQALKSRVGFDTEGKRGFSLPVLEALAGALQPLIQEALLPRTSLLGLPIRRGGLSRLNERLLRGDQAVRRGLWTLLVGALWEDAHMWSRGAHVTA